MRNKFISAASAAEFIQDGDTVVTSGSGGGLLEADALLAAVEARFLATGSPRGLRFMHSLGLGDRRERGANRMAYEGLVKKVITGHWVWSPRMQQLAQEEKIEAYVLPSGVMAQLMREIGAGRPGLITHVGLGTFVDPRQDGGAMNRCAKDELVTLIEIDGKTLLRYKPFPVHVALLRGSYADPDGNICLDEEAANLDLLAIAMAAHNSGGKVFFQVRTAVAPGVLSARQVRIPGALVDGVVVVAEQPQSHQFFYDPTISGEKMGRRSVVPSAEPSLPPKESGHALNVRQVIARRASLELTPDAIINYGFGIPDGIAKYVAAQGKSDLYNQTIEHGTYGGDLLDGVLFGFARNATCMIDSPSQFDFYGGGGLDIAFLGFGQFDEEGNVNVSKLGGTPVGPGGFIDIAQNARKVVFCGTFEAKGPQYTIGNGRLQIDRYGKIGKVVKQVEQITFSGPQALANGQEILYVTERAVFALRPEGIVLCEVAPGVDLQRDILDRMAFRPLIPETLALLPSDCFS